MSSHCNRDEQDTASAWGGGGGDLYKEQCKGVHLEGKILHILGLVNGRLWIAGSLQRLDVFRQQHNIVAVCGGLKGSGTV